MYKKTQPETIQKMFGSIANTYDRNNALLSLGMHKIWNRKLATLLQSDNASAFLDLCAGTGEITFSFLKLSKELPQQLYLLDFCEEMLLCAQQKAFKLPKEIQNRFVYLQADAQEIPLPDSSVDTVSIAYGIRNVQDPEKCLKEIFRVLKPGGTFAILELTTPHNPFLKLGHQFYLRFFLPLAGEAYQYLCNSIQAFIKPKELETKMTRIGFQQTRIIPLSGGIATILFAKKPI